MRKKRRGGGGCKRDTLLLAAAVGCASWDGAAAAACDGILPPSDTPKAQRDLRAEDLVQLRDIGQPDASFFGSESPLAVSPDHRHVAFLVNRADPGSNSYCRGLVVLPLDRHGSPRVIDAGGELITVTSVRRGLIERGGFPELVVPKWSPDGRWIAYLRRDNGLTQAWRARADGSHASPVTRSKVDVEAVAWSPDGRKLIYASRPAFLDQLRAVEREGRTGFLYDERFVPNWGPRPQLRAAPQVFFVVDPDTSEIAAASKEEARILSSGSHRYSDQSSAAVSDRGEKAWTVPTGSYPFSPSQVFAESARGKGGACGHPACRGEITGLWWAARGRVLYFLRREGWAKGQMALYRWAPRSDALRRVFLTDDVLHGCQMAGARLVCTREDSITPRHIVMIDPASGRSELLFDPNPEFRGIRLGNATRLKWRNALGLEAWGDLVVPPAYRPGEKLPLIVVQYRSQGFLRGGTGDEYPVHLFASRGFAVLSLERPAEYASLVSGVKTFNEVNAANAFNWNDRRSLLSAIETGVRQVIGMGVADPAKIGITGLSDGATTVRYALLNSQMFAAAAISTCCMDPNTVMTYGGIAWADYLHAQGYPRASSGNDAFWRPVSLAVDPQRMRTPLLMQLADSEYLLALETFTALREHDRPVEMYVFPGEHHAKWQPAHRLAIYERNVDWFNFWLKNEVDPSAEKAPQYRRWEALRERSRRISSKHAPRLRPAQTAGPANMHD